MNARAAFIRFAKAGQMDGQGARNRGIKTTLRTGYFQDLKTLATALLGQGHSLTLKKLAQILETEHQKLEAADGGPLTSEYLDYAMNDTQVTWECYEKLKAIYEGHGLKDTPAHRIYSETSRQNLPQPNRGSVPPSRKRAFQAPPSLLGQMLGTYYGGRSEVRIRRKIVRVLYCDFRSMYPAVCTLMGLWSFVTAKDFRWHDCAEDARRILRDADTKEIRDKKFWQSLPILVEIVPDEDILPIRAPYDDGSRTISLNYLSASFPMWFTLADCMASKLLSGKAPKVAKSDKIRAWRASR